MSNPLFFEISRKELLNPLKMLTGVVEPRQTLPILGNVLVKIEEGMLHLTATDIEVEIACSLAVESSQNGRTTIPARKFSEICRSLPDNTQIQVLGEENKVVIKSGKSKFSLSCLPAEDFPSRHKVESITSFTLPQRTLKDLFAQTQFSMAQNDVRYYLNGICLDLQEDKLSVVATDGHRLALATYNFAEPEEEQEAREPLQVIVPRKAVTELARMLDGADSEVKIELDENHIRIVLSENLAMSSKLIDGRFPDYQTVVPTPSEKVIIVNKAELKAGLTRAAILSNEKSKGVRLILAKDMLRITARNPEQEEAEEEVACEYAGDEFEIGFNVAYLLEALAVVTTPQVKLYFTDTNSSCLIMEDSDSESKWVIMPMRL